MVHCLYLVRPIRLAQAWLRIVGYAGVIQLLLIASLKWPPPYQPIGWAQPKRELMRTCDAGSTSKRSLGDDSTNETLSILAPSLEFMMSFGINLGQTW